MFEETLPRTPRKLCLVVSNRESDFLNGSAIRGWHVDYVVLVTAFGKYVTLIIVKAVSGYQLIKLARSH